MHYFSRISNPSRRQATITFSSLSLSLSSSFLFFSLPVSRSLSDTPSTPTQEDGSDHGEHSAHGFDVPPPPLLVRHHLPLILSPYRLSDSTLGQILDCDSGPALLSIGAILLTYPPCAYIALSRYLRGDFRVLALWDLRQLHQRTAAAINYLITEEPDADE
jgi:hypothetical protein